MYPPDQPDHYSRGTCQDHVLQQNALNSLPVYGELLFRQATWHATLLHPFLYVIDFKRALGFGEAQVHYSQFWAISYGSLKHADLVAQSQVLQLERSARIEDRRQICEECREGNEHQREL